MRTFLYLAGLLLLAAGLKAADPVDDSTVMHAKQYLKYVDSVRLATKYQTGIIHLADGKIEMNVPAGFRFLDAAQSKFMLTDIWGNPPSVAEDILGMIFPANSDAFDSSGYAFIVRFDSIGFVKDHDAAKINYDDLLKSIQKDEDETNPERIKNGYEPIHMVGWAATPFYDKEHKVLHWAKELKFGESTPHTLNYEVRVLGRQGVLNMNAVCTMNELPMVKADIDKILQIGKFTKGNTYADFDPKIDKIAAWTIGGLVAGKVLAKVGFFAIIAKYAAVFWKFILLGLAAVGGFFRNMFKRKKAPVYTPVEPVEETKEEE
ncbi:DUF2167 domain-containing protein [Chitinophaga sancti]|uniref:DUF2167 domain-containing protein n=1 Tax=Chitinophaga sancti TaxID=1004 RepID=A0A1K1NJH8_9BACT|nr:DUF2167 domain-containing protein [Chitinophaga sancti]WQD63172.1 DUF2167 domain-containing protein [Chitinophaga sancti]WQG91202.1 DUF2167 domain-containing protein [Chitinophaga sancti]SFW35455.1 Uncharacterized membrane-anchored protein [Chitinophaga sancti]